MAHELGQVCKFSNLEDVDTGDPKITDLDCVIEEEEEKTVKTITTRREEISLEEFETIQRRKRQQEQATCSMSSSSPSKEDENEDDIKTVKYLPLGTLGATEDAESGNSKANQFDRVSLRKDQLDTLRLSLFLFTKVSVQEC